LTERTEPVIECRGLRRSFRDAGGELTVLEGVDLTVAPGERVAIVGASGSGKTTLLQLLGGLDAPTGGEISICGRAMHRLGDGERGRLRNEAIGFVYQFHHLLPEFTAQENVAMPLLIRRIERASALESARELLARMKRDEITQSEAVNGLASFWSGRLRRAVWNGDTDNGSMMAGQSVGCVTGEWHVADIMDELIDQARSAFKES